MHIPRGHHRRRAFSLVELVIVLTIIGIVSAIAVPRFSGAGEQARRAQVIASAVQLQTIIDLYIVEHNPGAIPDAGALNGNSAAEPPVPSVLVTTTTRQGAIDANGSCGPYLRSIPPNTLRGNAAVMILSTNKEKGEILLGLQATDGWLCKSDGAGGLLIGFINDSNLVQWPPFD